MNIKVEYDSRPILHIVVQCPNCNKWFNGRDIAENEIEEDYQIYYARFCCPLCNKEFGFDGGLNKVNIEEVNYPEIYEGCLQRKEVWE